MPDLSRLSDIEQRILGLLTQGHTAKSAAMQLGISEAAVNERLREARRKTGVGSSRQLARLLAGLGPQKIGDEEIGMVREGGLVDPKKAQAVPMTAVLFLKVSTMIILASAVGAATAMALAGQFGSATTAPPRVIATYPANGAVVPAGKLALSVTFDRRMRAGYSFIMRDRATFPACEPVPRQAPDGKSFVLSCTIEPGRFYEVGFNNDRHRNFVSEQGLAAAPVVLRFSAR